MLQWHNIAATQMESKTDQENTISQITGSSLGLHQRMT